MQLRRALGALFRARFDRAASARHRIAPSLWGRLLLARRFSDKFRAIPMRGKMASSQCKERSRREARDCILAFLGMTAAVACRQTNRKRAFSLAHPPKTEEAALCATDVSPAPAPVPGGFRPRSALSGPRSPDCP